MSGRQPRYTWRYAALEPDSGLSWRARLAACVYCDFANGAGVLDPAPSAATVAERMGVALTTSHDARRELEEAGWLSIERRPGRPSRMVLSCAEPLRHTQGSEASAPARTRAPTPARTPAPGAPEPREPREPRGANAPARRAGDVVPLTPSTGAQELVAYFVDRFRDQCGEPAPRRVVGQVARQVGELLRDGVSAPTVARALDLLVEKKLHPSTLPSLVNEAAAGPRRDREHIADVSRRRALELRRQEEGS